MKLTIKQLKRIIKEQVEESGRFDSSPKGVADYDKLAHEEWDSQEDNKPSDVSRDDIQNAIAELMDVCLRADNKETEPGLSKTKAGIFKAYSHLDELLRKIGK